MLDEFGCRGHRFTQTWARSPQGRDRRVLGWAKRNGGCCCDCEVIMNSVSRPSAARNALLCPEAITEIDHDPWADDAE